MAGKNKMRTQHSGVNTAENVLHNYSLLMIKDRQKKNKKQAYLSLFFFAVIDYVGFVCVVKWSFFSVKRVRIYICRKHFDEKEGGNQQPRK